MFGYVRTYTPELRVREHEYYKGTYCGLCKSMGKCTGQCSRLGLNYDFVTFALIRFALTAEQTSFSQKRCLLHPLKKRNTMNRNAQLDLTAYISALLSYHKIRDDLADESFWRRVATRLFLLPSVSIMRRKALKSSDSIAELDRICAQKLATLSDYEKDSSAPPSVDFPASIFGEILGEFLACELDGSKRKIAYSAGYCLGKWIYIADALDDAEDDAKKKRFNPFLKLYGGKLPSVEQIQDIELALKNELFGLEAALDLIDCERDTTAIELIHNVIYLGMPKRIEEIRKKQKQH